MGGIEGGAVGWEAEAVVVSIRGAGTGVVMVSEAVSSGPGEEAINLREVRCESLRARFSVTWIHLIFLRFEGIHVQIPEKKMYFI